MRSRRYMSKLLWVPAQCFTPREKPEPSNESAGYQRCVSSCCCCCCSDFDYGFHVQKDNSNVVSDYIVGPGLVLGGIFPLVQSNIFLFTSIFDLSRYSYPGYPRIPGLVTASDTVRCFAMLCHFFSSQRRRSHY